MAQRINQEAKDFDLASVLKDLEVAQKKLEKVLQTLEKRSGITHFQSTFAKKEGLARTKENLVLAQRKLMELSRSIRQSGPLFSQGAQVIRRFKGEFASRIAAVKVMAGELAGAACLF